MAGVSDLLAIEFAGRLEPLDEARLEQVRLQIRRDVAKSLPVGSTEVEQLVQSAVEIYLRERTRTPAASLGALRKTTRDRIDTALKRT